MLLTEIKELVEMARPAKICPDCGKSMAGNHFWYKGGWRCKKSNRKADGEAGEESKKQTPPAAKGPQKSDSKKKDLENDETHREYERDEAEDDDPDVKAAEREEAKLKKTKAGSKISMSEIGEIDADSEAEARAFINDVFKSADADEKARALRIWKSRNKDK